MEWDEYVDLIRADFEKSSKILTAMGNQTRQVIITTLMTLDCEGVRVNDLAAKTHLSRPTVSHHVGILLDAGIIARRRVGTMNYYSLTIGEDFQHFFDLAEHIAQLLHAQVTYLKEKTQ